MLSLRSLLGFADLHCPILKRFAEKIREADEMREEMSLLVLGSSHAEKGFRAVSGEMNLGCDFEDLYVSERLFARYQDAPKLKSVILFYSVFSPGHDVIMTADAENAVAFKVVADIPYRDWSRAAAIGLLNLERTAKRKAKRHMRKIDRVVTYGNEKTYMTRYADMLPVERARGHLKNNDRGNDMTSYVRAISDAARSRAIRLVVVIPPATSGYRAALPPSDVLFRELYSFKDLDICNLYDSSQFEDDDFIDPDHLSFAGAEKLTTLLRKHYESCHL